MTHRNNHTGKLVTLLRTGNEALIDPRTKEVVPGISQPRAIFLAPWIREGEISWPLELFNGDFTKIEEDVS